MDSNWKNGDYWARKIVFLLLILLIFPTVVEGATFNFTVQTNTALNFENGSYIIEVIEISKQPLYVKVNLTSGGSSKDKYLYDNEPITFNEIKLTSSSITGTYAVITMEFPAGWGSPKQYQIVRPVLAPNIVLTKAVDKINIYLGDVVEIKIKMENTGNATAHNLTLFETPSKGFTITTGSRFPSVINAELAAGSSQEFYYALKAVESGTFKIEPATVNYDSKTSTSNSLTITVSEAAQEKSNLITVISLDKNNFYTGDLIKATIEINNTGNAPAKFVRIDFTPPIGLELIEDNLRIDDNIQPGIPVKRRIALKATETGNYSINLRTVYNDDPIGIVSKYDPIVVTQKEQNYLYVLVPIIIIIVGIVLFTVKRHKEYSY